MNKEFIPYEQSLELKELGFDEPTSFYWEDNNIRPLPMKDEVGAFHFNRHTHTENEWICAPLYQQAFRWFREKYNWSTEIRGANFRASYVIGMPETINYNSLDGFPLVTHWNYVVDDSGVRKTYQEAELACLIRLIAIAKKLELAKVVAKEVSEMKPIEDVAKDTANWIDKMVLEQMIEIAKNK